MNKSEIRTELKKILSAYYNISPSKINDDMMIFNLDNSLEGLQLAIIIQINFGISFQLIELDITHYYDMEQYIVDKYKLFDFNLDNAN